MRRSWLGRWWLVWATAAALVGLCGCSDGAGSFDEPAVGTSFEVQAMVNGQALRCDEPHEGVGATEATVKVKDLRLYVHDLVGIDDEGEHHPLSLVDDGKWQSETVALLNFSDGQGHCQEAMEERRQVIEVREEGPWVGLEFSIGVPREQNHLDVSTARAPLNTTAMFWSWTTGYKFLRLDLSMEESMEDGAPFAFHLGSTQCQPAPKGQIPECARDHRPRVRVASAALEEAVIQFDVGRLVEASALGDEEARCMSEADDPGCWPLFERLGVDDEEERVQEGIFWVGEAR